MAELTVEERLTALETEFNLFKRKEESGTAKELRGWQRVVGVFADDPEFEEAMRLGREYRESLRPQDDEAASC